MANTKIQNTGIMNKMRDKMPLIIIILIIAFLATIVFEWGMNYLGLSGTNEAFAKINSREISYQEYEKIVQQQIDQMRQQNKGKDVDEATINQIREQVWNSLISQTISQQAIEKYGIKVSDKEILDWIYNRPETLPEPIKRNFMDSTGVFNTSFYQQALSMKTKEATQFWSQVENFLRETMMSEKLQAILTEGAVVTEGDVLQKYKDDNIRANFDYVLLDLNTVTDSSLFKVTDEELKAYYEKNKNDFKQEESVKLKYLQFPEKATAEDSASLLREMESIAKDMKTAKVEDSTLIKLVNENSSTPWNPEFQKTNALDPKVNSFLFSAKPGDISGTLVTGSGYQVVKMLDSKESDEVYVNASHILINFGTDTVAAKKKADDIYKRVIGGENINDLAFELSEDPSAKQNRGDLGWFTKGAMVKEFEEAAFNAKIGDIIGPVKTKFGYHIIKVTGREKKEFKLAQITKNVLPSGRTKQLLKKKAEDMYSDLSKGQNIDTLAKHSNMVVQISQDITNQGQVPMALNNKKILKSLFENKINWVSEPVKAQDGYAIYEIIEKKPEGFQNFDSIKVSVIKPRVIDEKKFQILLTSANELEGKIKDGNIAALKEVSPQYLYGTADSVTVSKPEKSLGQDYALLSSVMKLKPGEVSKPIKGTKGYYIVKLNSITEFNQEDYTLKAPEIYKTLMTAKKQTIVSDWLNRMQNEAVIIDNRDKYF